MKKLKKIFFLFFLGGGVDLGCYPEYMNPNPSHFCGGWNLKSQKVHILWHQYQSCGTGNMSQLHHPCHKATTFGTYATTLLRLLIVLKLNN